MYKLFFVLLCTVSFLSGMKLKDNNSFYVEIRESNSEYSEVSPLHNDKLVCFRTRSLVFKNRVQITYELDEHIDDRILIANYENLLKFNKDHKDYRELRSALEAIAQQNKTEGFETGYQILYVPHVEKIQKIIDKQK